VIAAGDKSYRLEIIVPAGRRRYAGILSRYLESEADVHGKIDRVTWLLLTVDPGDVAFLRGLESSRPGLHRVWSDDRWSDPNVSNIGWRYIAQGLVAVGRDPGSVYVRMDDDIVYVSDGLLGRLGEAVVANSSKDTLLTMPFVLNNGRMAHRLGKTGLCREFSDCVSNELINDPSLAEALHRKLVSGELSVQDIMKRVSPWRFDDALGLNTNCVAWAGWDPPPLTLDGSCMEEYEQVVSWAGSRRGCAHAVDPSLGVVSHFAFWRQREHMDGTDVLGLYERLCDSEIAARKDT
jgi:hypothetical protein